MALLLVTLPGRLTVSAFAAIAMACIYMLLRSRGVASRIRLLLASSVCLLAVMMGFGLLGRRGRHTPARVSTPAIQRSVAAPTAPAPKPLSVSLHPYDAPRAVYGHSIVKGGIHSLGELLDVIATDPLAAQHYKGFDITRARFIRLDHGIMAYISYRLDGKGIYWTSKPELIPAGEEVITDGTNFIRVRCGNMISYAPQSPIETDDPSDTDTIVQTFTPFASVPLGTPAGVPSDLTSGGATPPGNSPPPPQCCSDGGYTPPPPFFGTPGAPITPNTPTPPGTVSVGEFSAHGGFYALLSAITALIVIRKLFP
jgi:hypothetical protein